MEMTENAAQTALITGASRGIGQAVALELGRRGYTVVGTATSGAGVDAIRASFQEHGLQGRAHVVDIAERASVEALIADLNQAGSLPAVLVNNAGATYDNLLLRMTEDEWQRCIDVNLGGVYRLTKACLRAMMKARFGRIINVTSVVGATGNPGQCNYAAAKAGTIGFTRALAREVASRGITVNAVAPGFIDTDMTRGLSDEWRAELMRNIPLGRLGTAAEVAAAVAFLASPDAAYITGHTLHLNGGMYMC
ncbi:MAG: 3-oxoacyl-ACP reductase FabG [Gammaproteobacteria bacterium]|nr:3-oxoacyl-ACP reductase FabG [Gammaproteobacteria bacterium]